MWQEGVEEFLFWQLGEIMIMRRYMYMYDEEVQILEFIEDTGSKRGKNLWCGVASELEQNLK